MVKEKGKNCSGTKQCPYCRSIKTTFIIDICTPGCGDNWYRANLYQCRECKMMLTTTR